MTPRQWLLSGLIVWHVTAVLLRATPDPAAQPPFVPAHPGTGWQGVVIAGMDAAGAAWAPAARAIGSLVRPLRPPFDLYIRVTGQTQTWAMFANPPRVDQYLRVRHYVQTSNGQWWMATQLVLPSHREDQVRLVQSFRDSYLDKALAVARDELYAHRTPALLGPDTRPDALPDDLVPIARYYARTFAQQHLGSSGDRVVRTEVWAGTAPNTPPGGTRDEGMRNTRRAVLREYYKGAVAQRLHDPSYPPYHAAEREVDIDWRLEYFEES